MEDAVQNQITEKLEGAGGDGRHDKNQTEQVEPSRCPAPSSAAEMRTPVVESAGCRVSRRDLCHGESHNHGKQTSHRPANTDRCPTGRAEGYSESCDSAR